MLQLSLRPILLLKNISEIFQEVWEGRFPSEISGHRSKLEGNRRSYLSLVGHSCEHNLEILSGNILKYFPLMPCC